MSAPTYFGLPVTDLVGQAYEARIASGADVPYPPLRAMATEPYASSPPVQFTQSSFLGVAPNYVGANVPTLTAPVLGEQATVSNELSLRNLVGRQQRASILDTSQASRVGQANSKEIRNFNIKAHAAKMGLQRHVLCGVTIRNFSPEDMQRLSVVTVSQTSLFGAGSINDQKMGGIGNQICGTCHGIECPGHFGIIPFATRMYNPAGKAAIIRILNSVCRSCGRLRRTEAFLREKGILSLPARDRLAAIEEASKNETRCPHPNKIDGSGNSIACGLSPTFSMNESKEKHAILYNSISKNKKNAGPPEVIPLEEVEKILAVISPETATILGFNPRYGSNIRNLIISSILVIPPSHRPITYAHGEVKQHPLTLLYLSIIKTNNELKVILESRESTMAARNGMIDRLYITVRDLLYQSKDSSRKDNKEPTAIASILGGKKGLVRGTATGKRVDFCGRAVIQGDVKLKFGQIRIPRSFAANLTTVVPIRRFNLKLVEKWAAEGQISFVISSQNPDQRIPYRDGSTKLRLGDKIERRLIDGDRVVFNRQPTLDRHSEQAYRIVVGGPNDEFIICLHDAVLKGHNADKDGDEGNIYVCRTPGPIAEAKYLMNTTRNICSEKGNRSVASLILDSLSGVYLLSDDRYLDDYYIQKAIRELTNPSPVGTLRRRMELFRKNWNSTQTLINMCFPEDFDYKYGSGADRVRICRGVLVRGRLTKTHLGDSSDTIIQLLDYKYGSKVAQHFLTDAIHTFTRWNSERYGMSLGYDDCVGINTEQKEKKVREALRAVSLEASPFLLTDPDPSRARFNSVRLNETLGEFQSNTSRIFKESLTSDNAFSIMVTGSQAKGNLGNIQQISALVGPQYIEGELPKLTLSANTRLFYTSDFNDDELVARGMIENSYLSQLSPNEMIVSLMTGRYGILGTTVKTPQVGAITRRLNNSVSSNCVFVGGGIREGNGAIIQYMYGNDGFDGSKVYIVRDGDSLVRVPIDIGGLVDELNIEAGWIRTEDFPDYPLDSPYAASQVPMPMMAFPNIPPTPTDKVPRENLSRFEFTSIITHLANDIENGIVEVAPKYHNIGSSVKIASQMLRNHEVEGYTILQKFGDNSIEPIDCSALDIPIEFKNYQSSPLY